jgi:hypothetical protein
LPIIEKGGFGNGSSGLSLLVVSTNGVDVFEDFFFFCDNELEGKTRWKKLASSTTVS